MKTFILTYTFQNATPSDFRNSVMGVFSTFDDALKGMQYDAETGFRTNDVELVLHPKDEWEDDYKKLYDIVDKTEGEESYGQVLGWYCITEK